MVVDLDVCAESFLRSRGQGLHFFECPYAISEGSHKVFPKKPELDVQVGVQILVVAVHQVLPQKGFEVVQISCCGEDADLAKIVRRLDFVSVCRASQRIVVLICSPSRFLHHLLQLAKLWLQLLQVEGRHQPTLYHQGKQGDCPC